MRATAHPGQSTARWITIATSFVSGLLVVLLAVHPAFAATNDCSKCQVGGRNGYCYAGQATKISTVTGVDGWISIPSGSQLGQSGDHIALWNGINDGSDSWVQVGAALGQIGPINNPTGSYEVYFENGQPGSNPLVDIFKTTIAISSGSAYDAEVLYDGMTGHLGDPQFDGYFDGTLVDAGEISTSSGVAQSQAEIRAETTTCPTLTSGSPWQNFGANASGTYTSNTELYLSTNSHPAGNFSLWTGNPTIYSADGSTDFYYWRTSLNGVAAFQTNGPSGGPA